MREKTPMLMNSTLNHAYCAKAHHTAAVIAVPMLIAVEYKLRSKLSFLLSNDIDRMPNRVG